MTDKKEKLWKNHDVNRRVTIIGIILLQILCVITGSAVITPSFTAMNQANMSLVNSDNIALGDYLFVSDNSTLNGESVLERNWTVNGPGYSSIVKNVTNPVFGPFHSEGAIFVNLTITNSTGHQYPKYMDIFQVKNGTEWVAANFSYDPAYDNRSVQSPVGTIRFFDTSIVKLNPEVTLESWWWKWTNRTGAISDNYSGGDEFTIPMNPWIDQYTVNLTVRNTQGNLVSVSDNVTVPPHDVRPISNFTVIPLVGTVPLEISVVDQSSSMANYTMTDIGLTYQYTIRNKTSSAVIGTFTTKNFNTTLDDPGLFNITQRVTNAFGLSDQSSEENIVALSPSVPEIDFSASPRSGTEPMDVSFTSLVDGEGPFTYAWDFGDGSLVSIDPHPVHQYTSPDVYNVTLQVTGAGGSRLITKTGYIAVSSPLPPLADFAVSPFEGSAPLNVSFIGLGEGSGTLLYSWNFGDGIGTGTGRNPSYTYDDPGLYTVTCTVSDGIRTGQVIRENIIRVLNSTSPVGLQAMFAASPRIGKAPLDVVFIDQSTGEENLTWVWDFGDNSLVSNNKNPTHTYQTPGIYNVTLQVRDSSGSDLITQSNFITVQSPDLPNADFTATPVTGPFPLNVSFIDQSTGIEPLSYTWDFGDGLGGSHLKNPVHVYTKNGTYSVNLTVTNAAGTSKSEKKDLIVVSRADDPTSVFTASPRSGPAPLKVSFIDQSTGTLPLSYHWDFGDGTPQMFIQNPTHEYLNPGIYTVTMEVTGPRGSAVAYERDLIEVTESVYPIAGFTVSPSSGAAPLTVKCIDQSFVDPYGLTPAYNWTFGDGNQSADKNPVWTYTTPGDYSINLTVRQGSKESNVSNPIKVGAYPVPDVSFSMAPMVGNAPLKVSFIDQTCNSNCGYKYFWQFGDGNTSSFKNPVYAYEKPGIYQVNLTVTDAWGISSKGEANDTITVKSPVDINIPLNASFTAVPGYGNPPVSVTFVDTSVGTKSLRYKWVIDDVEVSSQKSFSHVFDQSKDYIVNLTVYDETESDSHSSVIHVANLDADFVTDIQSGSAPLTVQFTDMSDGYPTRWYWLFGDGYTSREENPVYTYSKPGTYSVSLYVWNDVNKDMIKKEEFITVFE